MEFVIYVLIAAVVVGVPMIIGILMPETMGVIILIGLIASTVLVIASFLYLIYIGDL